MGGRPLIGAPLKFPARKDLGHGVFRPVLVASRLGELGGRISHQDMPMQRVDRLARDDGEHETDGRQGRVSSSAHLARSTSTHPARQISLQSLDAYR
jgi:hypothetical protein